jgi:hypothetical protein
MTPEKRIEERPARRERFGPNQCRKCRFHVLYTLAYAGKRVCGFCRNVTNLPLKVTEAAMT